jgi:hypothetical protein
MSGYLFELPFQWHMIEFRRKVQTATFLDYYADVTSAVAPVGSLDHACLQQRSCRLALIRLAYNMCCLICR